MCWILVVALLFWLFIKLLEWLLPRLEWGYNPFDQVYWVRLDWKKKE